MSVASIFIVGVLGSYLQGHVNQPIHALVETMALAGGDLSTEANVTHRDELGRLSASFNRMLRKIQESYEEKAQLMARIENCNRELQAEVERATDELAARHEELRQAHAQVFEVQRQLSRAERLAMVGQLAAMRAREVSTPFNTISGHVQLLLQRDSHRTWILVGILTNRSVKGGEIYVRARVSRAARRARHRSPVLRWQ
jgi:methyl-accepting chemotaxis protein